MDLGKWIVGSPSQYSLNKISTNIHSESRSMEELGPEHRNLWENGKWDAENGLESVTIEEVCSGEARGIQSRDRWHDIVESRCQKWQK